MPTHDSPVQGNVCQWVVEVLVAPLRPFFLDDLSRAQADC